MYNTIWGTATLHNNGYYKIASSTEGNLGKYLHRLIWEKAWGKIPKDWVIHHLDGNKQNNKVSNLEWCTNSYNLIYSKGKKVAQYTKEGEFIKDFNCVADASRECNIPTTNISKCCKGKRYSAGNFIWRYVR